MTFRQHCVSRTLPKNFIFSSVDEPPKTPEGSPVPPELPPPPPRFSSCRSRKFRVRSGTDIFARSDLDPARVNDSFADVPLASIEVPPPEDDLSHSLNDSNSATNDHLLAPPLPRLTLKTPPAQIRPDIENAKGCDLWSVTIDSKPWIPRRSSVCSVASDSSASSIETFATRHSMGGSCTSPETDIHDPFSSVPKKQLAKSPSLLLPQSSTVRAVVKKERWTLEMDNHLWNTYQLYLQNPTITPFKMTPGSIPPLGVTHRVARQAKKTWEKRRLKSSTHSRSDRSQSTSAVSEPGRRDVTSASSTDSQSGDTTPRGAPETRKPLWPKSETSTRKRLKLLCRRRFTIAPHYQRMMESRSPSPFLDLFAQPVREASRLGPLQNTTAYATRDLGVSLSSSIPGPLSQLTSQDQAAQEIEWFNDPVERRMEQFSPKIPHTVQSSKFGTPATIPRLGSPFVYRTWGPESSTMRKNPRHMPIPRRDTIHVADPKTRPHLQINSLPCPPSSFHHPGPLCPESVPDERAADHRLRDLLHQGKLDGTGHRRVRIRNRGASASAVPTSRNIDQLFSPPSPPLRQLRHPHLPVAHDANSMSVPDPLVHVHVGVESIKRLGSPFKVGGRVSDSTTIRPSSRHAPSLSEPFASDCRLPKLSPALQAQQLSRGQEDQRQRRSSVLPYDPIEEGISDAERIRRQILNLAQMRQRQ